MHTDVLSVNIPSNVGNRYVVTFVDDHSCMLWFEALARKSDIFGAFQRFTSVAFLLSDPSATKAVLQFLANSGRFDSLYSPPADPPASRF